MKIAISSRGEDLGSEVDARFGRARYFIVYDTDSDSYEVIENIQNLNAMQGAGIQSASNVVQCGVEYVLTGHCGPKAFRTLTEAGIKVVVGVEGTVGDAVEKFKKGEYKPVEEPDVESHWV